MVDQGRLSAAWHLERSQNPLRPTHPQIPCSSKLVQVRRPTPTALSVLTSNRQCRRRLLGWRPRNSPKQAFVPNQRYQVITMYLRQYSTSNNSPAQVLMPLLWPQPPSPPAPRSIPAAPSHHTLLLPPYETLPTPRHFFNTLNNCTHSP